MKYKDFVLQGIPNFSESRVIGIRMSEVNKISSRIIKENKQLDYLESLTSGPQYLEIDYITANVIGSLKIDGNSITSWRNISSYINSFVSNIDNWSSADKVGSAFRPLLKEHKSELFKLATRYMKSNKVYYIRVGIVIMIFLYIKIEYVDVILNLAINIKKDHYYVNMAIAWLITSIFSKFSGLAMKVLEDKKFSKWVHNKAISKICDSNVSTKKEKDIVRNLRIK